METGLRHGEPVLLKVLSQAMGSDGYVFYRLDNGVWLTVEVPIRYIVGQALDRATGLQVDL